MPVNILKFFNHPGFYKVIRSQEEKNTNSHSFIKTLAKMFTFSILFSLSPMRYCTRSEVLVKIPIVYLETKLPENK